MDWATIRETIRSTIGYVAGVASTDIRWVGTPEAGTWHNSPHIDLVLSRVAAVGVDESRYEYLPDPDDAVKMTQAGQWEITVMVRVEADSQVNGEEAVGQLMSNIRTRLRRPEILSALQTNGLALARIEDTINADFVTQDRMVSLAQTNLLFLAAESDYLDDFSDFIENVQLDSDTLDDPAGDPEDPQISILVQS